MNAQPPSASVSASGSTLVLRRVAVRDPWINNMVAGTVLVPDGWKAEGGIVWGPNPWYPASLGMAVANPAGAEAVFFYPQGNFIDGLRESAARIGATAGPGGAAWMAASYPEGSFYLGSEVRRQVASPADYVRLFVLPRSHRDLRGARVVAAEDLPELARAKAALVGGGLPGLRVQCTRVRLAYRAGGQDVEEDFYCTLGSASVIPGTVGWQGSCESYRAARGELDRVMPMLRVIGGSPTVNLEWFNQVAQIGQMMQQNIRDASRRAVELSAYLSRTNHEISETIRHGYEDRQRALDGINDRFDQYIRGVQKYADPFDPAGHTVEAPAGYEHVFVNPLGEVIASNDAFFKPGQVLNGDWREVQAKR